METPKLYSSPESGNSYKIRLLASILNIKLDVVDLDLTADEQHSPEYLALNPRGEVPCLIDGTKTLTDSAAILVYLAGKHADAASAGEKPSSYWSKEVGEQAEIVDWLAFAASWVQYGVFTARAIVSFGGSFNGLGAASTEQSLKEAQTRGHKSLGMLQQRLEHEDWLALGRPTIADIGVFPYVALAPMGDVSLSEYPAVEDWIARMKKLPNFIPIQGLDDPDYRRR